MARGKAAAQNANRRAAEAAERAAALAGELRAEKAARHDEVTELREELRSLRFDIGRLADERAAERVTEVQRAAAAEVVRVRADAQEKARVSVQELLTAFFQGDAQHVGVDVEHIATVARRFDVEPDMISKAAAPDGEETRYGRRITWAEYVANVRRWDNDPKALRVLRRRLDRQAANGQG